MPNSFVLFLLAMAHWMSTALCQIAFDEEKFASLVAKMEGDVRELAREVERLYESRCLETTITSCEAANYANCRSLFPDQTCPGGPGLDVDTCGDDGTCSALWDFTVSATRIPGDLADGVDGNPTNPKLIETLCFTRTLDSWFVQKREQDSQFWQSLGVEFPSMYFGSNNGAFRIYPARHTENCNAYDPRIRPWYVAGSSGPKNIILILDISGSMETRLPWLKIAATRIVQTLTVQDRIAIIPFESDAVQIVDPNGYMYRATAENIQLLTQKIDDLTYGGRTNFYDAFDAAFNAFNTTVDQELNANCNSAILFFTDGERTDGPENSEVTSLIQDRIATIQPLLLDRPILLFTFSISEDPNIHTFPSQLSCAVEQGVWSLIPNDEAIVESLSSYYQLFALGLGSDLNEEFVAWVEPYPFFTSNRLGTTVSSPVYDRSRTPHTFLGVVGADIPIAAIDAALGGGSEDTEAIRAESIRRVVDSSRVVCPSLDLNKCEMESFRRFSMPDGSGNCLDNCTADELVQVEEVECPGRPDYPRNYWENLDVLQLDHTSRVCCFVGETTGSKTCSLQLTPSPTILSPAPLQPPSTMPMQVSNPPNKARTTVADTDQSKFSELATEVLAGVIVAAIVAGFVFLQSILICLLKVGIRRLKETLKKASNNSGANDGGAEELTRELALAKRKHKNLCNLKKCTVLGWSPRLFPYDELVQIKTEIERLDVLPVSNTIVPAISPAMLP